MLKMAMLKDKIKINMLMKIEGYDILVQGNSTQALQTLFSFDLELIGMSYY